MMLTMVGWVASEERWLGVMRHAVNQHALNGGRTSKLEDKRWQRDNTMEAPLLKILIPIGPFCYGDTSHALNDGLDPPKIREMNGGLRHHRTTGQGYGRGCTSLPHDSGEPSVRGGDSLSCHDGIVSFKKGLPGLAGIGLDKIGVWSVQLIRAYPDPDDAGGDESSRSMKNAPLA